MDSAASSLLHAKCLMLYLTHRRNSVVFFLFNSSSSSSSSPDVNILYLHGTIIKLERNILNDY